MKKIVAALASLGVAYFIFASLPSVGPEKQVRAMLGNLAKEASFATQIPQIEALGKSKTMSQRFSEESSFEILLDGARELRLESRKRIREHLLILFKRFDSFSVEFKKIRFQRVEKREAEVILEAYALGSLMGVDGQFFEAHKLSVALEKDDSWLITSVRHLENLRE